MNVIGTSTAARILGLTQRSTQRLVEAEQLPSIGKLEGGTLLFDEAVVLEVRDARIAARRAELDALESTELAS